jgi:hypothetical protein
MFVVWAENTDCLVADLMPGRIYFVETYITPGAFSAHFHLKAIKPSLPNWARRDEYMARTTQFAVDQAAGQDNLVRKKGADAVQERIRRAQEHFARYQGEEIESRTLGPNDGI